MGTRNQVIGLAEALGVPFVEKIIGLGAPWGWFPGNLLPSPLRRLDPAKDQLVPPWPDVLITSGRRSTGPSIAIREASGGKTVTVHIQNPQTPLAAFDLIVAMPHDDISGPNVIVSDMAMHRVSPAMIEEGRRNWKETFDHLPKPLTAVILGGPNKHHNFTLDIADDLISYLVRLNQTTGCGLVITPSRRTPELVKARLAEAFSGTSWCWTWDESGDNPYFGMMALADSFVVTADSVSMISEAVSTRKPVSVVKLAGVAPRHDAFVAGLIEKGTISIFDGMPIPFQSSHLPNATEEAAGRLKSLLAERGIL
ncbi:MAG: mitochondrial fission ELM1 family protein [Hyphomicrobiales bacterium]